ncbi:MAG: DEAD/DEAH box helicase family protein, partial [Paludibacteraceae bacterium]|nr:DEAD/DEAH box helicase family protein [Paludibacteraceae bacterium]
MMFRLESAYQPTGDQPQAIAALVDGIRSGARAETLLGVTGSGKTFTIANVIAQLNRPTLILSHNKTLAAQLYSEMKAFFPHNAVEYFVSYYDYYQPEAYIPSTDTYIEKDLSINEEIDRLRLSATAALLSGRKDVIVVSSVSCLYGIGSPQDFSLNCISIRRGQTIQMDELLKALVAAQYVRNDAELARGKFRVKGDTVDIALAYADYIIRVEFFGNTIDSIASLELVTLNLLEEFEFINLYPATIFCTSRESIERAIGEIKRDLDEQISFFHNAGMELEAKRIDERVHYDIEMIQELGYCSGVENYSRYFDGREPGTPPYCLLDYFPDDMLVVVDESHVTIPQIHAMYGGDKARKDNLVQYGFRLPAARDNRPLTFEEWEEKTGQTIYLSATPAEYELEQSEGIVVEQLIRPTGLLDPAIDVRPSEHQVDDLLEEIHQRVEREQRVLVTTLTKRMA